MWKCFRICFIFFFFFDDSDGYCKNRLSLHVKFLTYYNAFLGMVVWTTTVATWTHILAETVVIMVNDCEECCCLHDFTFKSEIILTVTWRILRLCSVLIIAWNWTLMSGFESGSRLKMKCVITDLCFCSSTFAWTFLSSASRCSLSLFTRSSCARREVM